jgi:uncharacterized protein (TIGR02757 family)
MPSWVVKMIGEKLAETDLLALLEERADFYNTRSFIEPDPISVPHRYTNRLDIEIAGFLTAAIAWGQRKTLIRNALQLMEWMDDQPGEFIKSFDDRDLKPFRNFVHRTFNGEDCVFFLRSLQEIIRQYHTLEQAFLPESNQENLAGIKDRIVLFRKRFLGADAPVRLARHVSDPERNAAAKRLNMFLRWMVRKDERQVDFGIWKKFCMADLMIPLDVHSGNVARKLGLLKRSQDDWKAVEELTDRLRKFNPSDPVKYDYALFGMGVNDALVLPGVKFK